MSSSRASSRTRTCRSITRPRMRSRLHRSSRPRGSSSWRRSRPDGRSPARTIARSPSSCARVSTGPCSSRTTCAAARLQSSAACASPTGCTRPPGRRHSGSRSSDAPGAWGGSTIASWPRDEDGRAPRGAGRGRPSPGSADLCHRPHVERSEVSATLFESLEHQTIPPDEVLVADSGSSDDTPEVARRASATVVEGERRGPGEGRNRGARKATGDVLVFVDADCILPPNLIESVFLAFADPAVVGGATGFAPAQGRRVERSLFYLANAYQRAMTIWGIPHNAGYCFFFRKTAFESLGGIREDLVLNETHDLAIRSRSIGRFVLLPIIVETSMRRFRTYGYLRTILQEYVASTILYYATGRSPRELFRPAPAR